MLRTTHEIETRKSLFNYLVSNMQHAQRNNEWGEPTPLVTDKPNEFEKLPVKDF